MDKITIEKDVHIFIGDDGDYSNYADFVLSQYLDLGVKEFIKQFRFYSENDFIKWLFEFSWDLENSCKDLVTDIYYVTDENGDRV